MVSPSTDRRFGLTAGVAIKAPCQLATTVNITLNGEQTIDGTLTDDSRVLTKDQTDLTENGIYRSDDGDWVREPDANGNRDLVFGTLVYVNGGSANASTNWVFTSDAPEIGTDDINIALNTSFPVAVSNTTEYELGSQAAAASHTGIITGHVIRTNYFDGNRTIDSDSEAAFTGTTTAARDGGAGMINWPYLADGKYYDQLGQQFDTIGASNVRAFGATGDGATDDTVAIQSAINSLTNLVGSGELTFPRATYIITTALVIPLAWARNHVSFLGSVIKYNGAVDATEAVFSMTATLANSNVFEGGYLDANEKAGFVFYVVPTGAGFSIKKNTIRDCTLAASTVLNIQIGNETVSGVDLDGADWSFENTYFIHDLSAGVRVDGVNCFNIGFRHCWFNTVSGSNSTWHCQFYNGSGYYMFDIFFGFLGAGTATYCIDHRNGNLTVIGANTEEGSILKTSGMVNNRRNIYLANIMVNESTASATKEYAVYAPVGHLTIESCSFGKDTSLQRDVYVGDVLHATSVYLGTNASRGNVGIYELDRPDVCSIEGQYLNNVKVLNGNPTLQLWDGTAVDDLPFGYNNSGFGTSTIQKSALHVVQGDFTAKVVVAVGYATGTDIDGLQVQVPLWGTAFTGMQSAFYVVRGYVENLVGTTTLVLKAVNKGDGAGVYGADSVTITPAGDGTFEGVVPLLFANSLIANLTATIGTGVAGASADIYVDNMYVVPLTSYQANAGFHSYTMALAWTAYPQTNGSIAELSKAGVIVGGTGSDINTILWGSAAPTAGKHKVGDIVLDSAAAPGQPVGQICVTAGIPGTWAAFGGSGKNEVTLTTSQVNNLRGTPIELVPAPGAGLVIEFISAMLFYDYTTTAFTVGGDEDFVIQYDASTDVTASIETAGFIDQTNDEIRLIEPTWTITTDLVALVNKKLEIFNTGTGETADGGTSTLKVIVNYRVHNTGL